MLLLFSSCLTRKEKQLSSQKWMSGMIFSNSNINKTGKSNPEAVDYYFRLFEVNYFIKLSECSWDGDISDYNMNYVRIKGEIKNGYWDKKKAKTNARIGNYIVFSEIERIEQALKIVFVDGNGNIYTINRTGMHYNPVPVMMSSSRTYSGGKEKEIVFGLDFFMDIYFLVTEMQENEDLLTTERNKASGSFKITKIHNEEKSFFISESQELSNFQSHLNTLFERFSEKR